MLKKESWTRITLEAYNFETFPDEIMFFNPTESNGNNTWNGMSLPSLCVFQSAENGPAFGVGLRSIYFNGGITVDGLSATVAVGGMRIVDPAYPLYNGPLADWGGFNGASVMSVDWGDGSSPDSFDLTTEGIDPLPQHTYAEAGTYTVTATALLGDTGTTFAGAGGTPSVTLDIEVMEP